MNSDPKDDLFNDLIDHQAIDEILERAHANTLMPFGRHKGTPISQLPTSYLAWLRARLHEKEEEEGSPLFEAMEYEWKKRFGENPC